MNEPTRLGAFRFAAFRLVRVLAGGMPARRAPLAVVMTVALAASPAVAQHGARMSLPSPPVTAAPVDRPPPSAEAPSDRPARETAGARQLPAESATTHVLDVGGRTLEFTATAAAIPLFDDAGALQAEVTYVSFVAGGAATPRPVTFLVNGGPGAASAYLNIGAIGPWRLPLARIAPSVQPTLVPNAETWLDFTDLVFIDPPGTGYSRIAAGGEAARRRFWSVDGDADALAVVVRKWIEKAGRQAATKFIVGESYGGFRAPKIARALQGNEGVGIRGLVMISPVIDFAGFGQRRQSPMTWVAHLPSMASAALEAKGRFDRDALREAEAYASGDYLRDLIKGERDAAAVDRMSVRVAALTGLDPALVRRLGGRVDRATFQRELYRDRGLVGSAYDPTVTAFDPHPHAAVSRFSDPMLDGLTAPLTTAMTELYQRILKWRVDKPYLLLNREVSSRWDWGRGRIPPEAFDDLRDTLAADADVRVLVAHGASDLVTPYFASQLLLAQLPAFAADRLTLAVHAGGHMFYNRDASRRAFRADAAALYRAAAPPAQAGGTSPGRE